MLDLNRTFILTDDYRWFDKKNNFSEEGSLGLDPMGYSGSQNYFDIYKDNGVKILLLIDDKKKVHGRALIWSNVHVEYLNLVSEGWIKKDWYEKIYDEEETIVTLMDCIYTNNSADEKLFKEYAEKKKWEYKRYQDFDQKKDFNGYKDLECFAWVEIHFEDYTSYPDIDTFTYGCNESISYINGKYLKEGSILHNDYGEIFIAEFNQYDGRFLSG